MTEPDRVLKAWKEACDALDVLAPIDVLAARDAEALDLVVSRMQEILREELCASQDPRAGELLERLIARLERYQAHKLSDLEVWEFEEARSRRHAEATGECWITHCLLDYGYVTTGERNWLTHPEMRRESFLNL